MAEKVGLIAVLDLSQFNRNFASYTRALGQMNNQTSTTASGINNSFLSLGDSVNDLAGKIMTGLVAALAAAGVAVGAFVASGISQAADLEAQLDGINAILGNTEEQGQAVKDAIVDLGINPNLKVSASEAAQAVELLARNGLSTQEIIGKTGDIMDSAAFSAILLANATGSEFGLAADIATDAMAVFNIRAEDMVSVVDDIVGVTNNSKFTIQDYSLALRNGGAAAADMGVSMTDFNTVIAASAEELGTGMKAGTGFRNFLTRLTPNTNTATDAMKSLGLITAQGNNIFFDSEGKLKNMADITVLLNQALYGSKEVISEVGGRTAEQNQLLADLRDTYDSAAQKVYKYENGLIGLNLSDEARNKKIAEQQDIMATLLPRIQELDSIRGDLVTTTTTLTDQERSMALEAIFGADAMNTVIALAKEGAPAFTDVATAMQELGVSQAEATRIVEEGVTAYELLYGQIDQTDAVDQAAQRMANFKGVIEILKGIIESIQIEIGDVFLPILTRLGEYFTTLVSNIGPQVISFFQNVGSFITEFVDALIEGESPLQAFTDTLKDFGFGDIASKIEDVTKAIEDFITPIITFVQNHSDAFIGALTGIGAVLASAGIAAKVVSIGSALLGLLNPVTLIIAGVAALGVAFATDFGGITTAFNNIVTSIQEGSFTWESAWAEIVNVANNIWTMIEPSLTALWTNITTWFNGIDWSAIGMVLWNSLLTAGGNIWAFVLPKLTELLTNIQTWFQTTDWAAIGQTLWNSLMGGSESLGEKVGTWISTIYESIIEWLNTVDWSLVGSTILTYLGAAIAGLVGLLWTYINVIYEFISGFIQSADWWSIASNLVTSIFNALVELFAGIGTVLQGWYDAFVSWVSTVDWLAIGNSIVTFVINALGTFVTFVGEKLAGWYQAFVDWVAGIDWYQIGYDIVTFILDGLVTFVESSAENFADWYQAFADWVESVDWYQIGYDIVDFIIEALEFFYVTIPETLDEWYQSFIDWIIETDWKQMGLDIIEFIIKGLIKFQDNVQPTLSGWWQAFLDWFTNTDWSSLAQKVIDGIVSGLTAGAAAIGNAISGLVSGITDRWNQDTESHSPSKLAESLAGNWTDGIVVGIRGGTESIVNSVSDTTFGITNAFNDGITSGRESNIQTIKDWTDGIVQTIKRAFNPVETGKNLGDAFVDAIASSLEEGQSLIEGFFDVAGELSSIGGTFSKIYEEREIKPLEDRLKGLENGIKETLKGDRGKLIQDFLVQFDIKSLADLEELGGGIGAFLPPDAVNAAREYLTLNEERLRVADNLAEKEAKILELQKQQQDLQILETQFKLLDLIQSKGLDASQILGGLEFGLDASLPDLIQAMSGAMQQLIASAEGELGIASPSKVFENIGLETIRGFTNTIKNQSAFAAGIMGDFTKGIVSSTTSGLSTINNNTNRSRNISIELSNNFSNQPQVTDRSQLELLLASFV